MSNGMLMESTGLRHRFFRSTSFNVLGQIVIMVGNLVVTPSFIRHLGADGYGLWALVLALSGTAAGFDMGMSVGLVRAVPEYLAKKQHELLSSLTGAVVVFYLALSAVAILASLTLAPWLMRLFGMRTTTVEEVTRLLVAATVILTASNLAGVTRAILQGLNRFDLVALLSVGSFAIFAATGLILLDRGHGLTSLVIAIVVMYNVQLLVGILLVRRMCPVIRWNGRQSFKATVWSYLFGFGLRIQVSYLADICKTQVPKLLAAAFFGPAAAGYYDLGNRVANAGWTIPAAMLPAVIPTASEVETKGDPGQLRNIYLKGTKWLLVVALPLGVVLALFSREIFYVWLGPGYESASFVLLCLSLGNVLHLMTGVGTFIGRGIARPGIEARYQVLNLFLYIILCFTLQKLMGFQGIPLGVAVASFVGAFYFLWSFSGIMSVSLTSFLSSVIKFPVMLLIPALMMALFAVFILDSRVSVTYMLIASVAIYSVVYASALVLSMFVTDRRSLAKFIEMARSLTLS